MECADKNAADVARSIAYKRGAELSSVNRVEQHPTRKSDGRTMVMEVDTGAAVSLMSEAAIHNLWGNSEQHSLRWSPI